MLLISAVLFAAAVAVRSPAHAETYPDRPITLIVVFAAGGPSDTYARLLAEHVGRQLGQQIVVENVPGAGGTLGTARAASAAPDGYTILTHHMGMAAAPALYANLKFDPKASFEPVGLVNTGPMVLLGRKTLPPSTLGELVAWLKEQGEKATIAFAGVGSNSFICASVLQQAAGVKPAMVPYRGTGPAMTDLLGGQIDLLCDQATTAVPQVQSGTVKAFAVTSPERLASLPDVPGNREAGLPGFDVTIWNGIYAPKGTPKVVIERWNEAIGRFVTDPAVVERLAATGTVVFPPEMRTVAAHARFLDQQLEFFARLFAQADVRKLEAK
jgi:tripartite-type tricarboxylate transporter receptor subunit TctC